MSLPMASTAVRWVVSLIIVVILQPMPRASSLQFIRASSNLNGTSCTHFDSVIVDICRLGKNIFKCLPQGRGGYACPLLHSIWTASRGRVALKLVWWWCQQQWWERAWKLLKCVCKKILVRKDISFQIYFYGTCVTSFPPEKQVNHFRFAFQKWSTHDLTKVLGDDKTSSDHASSHIRESLKATKDRRS